MSNLHGSTNKKSCKFVPDESDIEGLLVYCSTEERSCSVGLVHSVCTCHPGQ